MTARRTYGCHQRMRYATEVSLHLFFSGADCNDPGVRGRIGMSKAKQKQPRVTDQTMARAASTDREPDQFSFTITGFKIKFGGRALLVLTLGLAAAMGGTIAIKVLIF